MCGIAGFWDCAHRFGADGASAVLQRMTRAIRHRGPDDEGFFLDTVSGVALGHRRLSVVDLSPQGHQPMASPSGRYVMVFNGEVYNHGAIRSELEKDGFSFRGHSDTEVMLAAIECWGLDAALSRFVGMFAFALWDKTERALFLARDRLGIKPLYCGWVAGAFVFASELKALAAFPGFDNALDRDALCLYLRHNAVPAPYSIYRNIGKLMPGSYLRVTADLAARPRDAGALAKQATVYWSARQVAEEGGRQRLVLSDAEATSQLDALLRNSVALHMEADVPLGAFLSGGVDSSVVVALMQAQSSRPVQTFSIGFNEPAYNEAEHAKAVARHLGTDHHELYVTAQDALDVVPMLPTLWDEPFGDSSQVPTYLVSKLARTRVTVSLSGDGGDELFAGYNRYFWATNLRSIMGRVPYVVRRSLAGLARAQPGLLGGLLERAMRLLPARLRLTNVKGRVGILADMLAARSDDERYRYLVSHFRDPESLVLGGHEPMSLWTDASRRAVLADPVEGMMYSDLVSYLPDDVLTKVDRASMAVSLEARVPLLDHRLVEFAWRIPMAQKVRDGQGKWLLRQVLYNYVPKNLIERPKMGFGVPIDSWLRGPLRDWAEDLLSEQRLRDEGVFDPAPIRVMWRDHLAGRVNEHYRLWDVLMFQAWWDGVARSRLATVSANSLAARVIQA